MLISALFEVITIGSVVPLVATIIGGSVPSFISAILGFLFIDVTSFDVSNSDLFVKIFIGFVILIILSTFFRLVAQYGIIWYTNQIGFDLTNRSYGNILKQDYQFHVGTNSSEVIATINKVQSLMNGVIAPVLQSISSSIVAISILVFLIVLNWKIAAVAFVLIALTYLMISYIVRQRLDVNSAIIAKAHSDRIKSVNEALGNIRELILGDRQIKHYHSFLKTEIGLKDASVQNGFISVAPKFLVEGIGIVVLLFTAFFLTSSGLNAIEVLPTIGAFAFATQKLLPALQGIFQAWSKVSGNFKLIEDVLSFLTLRINEKKPVRTETSEFKKLSFVNVCFHYDNGFEVLKDVNLEINKGKVIGIVGETGSGKSTFLDLLSQLTVPTSGKIYATDENGQELSQSGWQSTIAYVPQNPYFLDQSILNNISLDDGPDNIDMANIRSIVEVSQLSKVMDELEAGIETIIGERGAKLSGGQLQRISIARALYADKQVLIFDEATSALDHVTERLLLSSLKKEFVDKTVIIITHRSEALVFCNEIFKIENKELKQIK
tara:strand:- start:91 stop:1740 length:1650 start_codon:yes stop_codon:yes gene_type:complete